MGLTSGTQAERVAKALLETTERALFSNDFAAFLSVTALPFEVETYDGKLVCQTASDLRAAFNAVVASNHAQNVTGYQRDLVSSIFTSAVEIKYAYVTRRLSGHMLVEGAYPSIAIAKLVDGEWKITSSQHAKENAPEYRELFTEAKEAETKSKPSEPARDLGIKTP